MTMSEFTNLPLLTSAPASTLPDTRSEMPVLLADQTGRSIIWKS